ncbi:Tetratricopeptide-like helical [Cynara cardunculus var. scolymus]|uniref:Tetratricopeptide-like helical n=1 Tax=Cynara cardunculus var. scolymus TaxID=59895 RepID=A0A118JUJ3_CYNCS|nr:Tetratricopeptide-like helical [Cynara cardunculus var. scolymus]
MGLAWLASRALRSSSSRVLSYRTIFSTPDLCKPVALGARFHFPNSDPKSCSVHIARFYYHDQLSISVNWRKQRSVASSLVALLPALFLGLSLTPVLAEDASTELTETDSSGSDFTGLRKIDDGSGKLEDAERLFVGALQEAKEGFGERDPHVASACNNLAELYRVKKAFDKAEPLYLEAINILEESYGHEDVRVGAALHNLGQFYLLQKKLDAAHACYKIKRQVLGEDHADYAETMYHLGKVLYLQGNVKDAEALITESIQIFEVHSFVVE